jgi:hypothetical protein
MNLPECAHHTRGDVRDVVLREPGKPEIGDLDHEFRSRQQLNTHKTANIFQKDNSSFGFAV